MMNNLGMSSPPPYQSPGPMQIDWLTLPFDARVSGSIAISSLPGCRFRSVWRNMKQDIELLRAAGITEVVVLCTRGELSKYRVPLLLAAYEESGILVHHWPFQDGTIPAIDDLLHLLQDVQLLLQSGSKVLIHCYGGLGRACLVAACLLLELDEHLLPEVAIERMRQLRGPSAIQTVKQFNFILDFRQLREEYISGSSTSAPRSLSR